MLDKRQFCTFYVDRLFFGVEVEKVQEVIRYQPITRVPLAPMVFQGLINLRGQIITALDLRRRLELDDRAADHLPMNVVIKTQDGPVTLLVDEIGDVQDVHEDVFETVPETLSGIARELIHGAYKLKDRLLLILDTERIVNLCLKQRNSNASQPVHEL